MKRVKYRDSSGGYWGELRDEQIHPLVDMTGERMGGDLDFTEVAPPDVTLLAPCEPRAIVCVGKNYAEHIREMGGDEGQLPSAPGLFLKALNTLSNPGDAVPYPSWTQNLHYEGELAVVVGKRMKEVAEADALAHVLGYTCALDVTARDKQRSDLQWTRGKSADGFCPLGPWLETDLDPSNLSVQTRVNGELKQDGNTADLIFSVGAILAYVSTFMTLEPGDVVLTGTPDGVGPLHVGDEVEVSVEGVGTLKNRVEAA